MNVVAIIPARMDSSRFPGKALHPIAGIPMIQRVYGQVRKAPIISQVFIATSDAEINKAVTDVGYRCVLTSEDNDTGTDRVAEACKILQLGDDTIVVNVQGDQPLVNPACLEYAVLPFQFDARLEMCTLAIEIKDDIENKNKVKVVVDENSEALYFSRSPIPHGAKVVYKHLGIYSYTVDFLCKFHAMSRGVLEKQEGLEQLRVLEKGHKIRVITTDYDSPSVDVLQDIVKIERLL